MNYKLIILLSAAFLFVIFDAWLRNNKKKRENLENIRKEEFIRRNLK